MFKSNIAGFWGRLIPNFLRNHHTDLQSNYTSLYFYQQQRNVPMTRHPLQYKLSSVYLILAVLTCVRWYLRILMMCIYLMIKYIGQFLTCPLVIWNSSAVNSLFSSVPNFLIGMFYILMSSFLSSLCILENSPLSDVRLMKIYSHSVGCRFLSFTMFFAL